MMIVKVHENDAINNSYQALMQNVIQQHHQIHRKTQQIRALEKENRVLKWQILIQNKGGLPLDLNYHYTVCSIKGNRDEETVKGTIVKDTENA